MSMSRLAELLDSFAKRPTMYVGVVTLHNVQCFCYGLEAGLRVAGHLHWSTDDYANAANARGWSVLGMHGIRTDFEAKGLTEHEMAQEYIAIIRDAHARVARN